MLHRTRLRLIGGQDLHGDDLPDPVRERKMHIAPALRRVRMLRDDHGSAAHLLGDRLSDAVGLHAHGIRQAAGNFIYVAAALFRDAVLAVLFRDVRRIHQFREAVGIIKIADAVVAENEIGQRLRIHRCG